MANYPQLDNSSGVWNLRDVYDAVMGGYWPNANSNALVGGGLTPGYSSTIDKFNMTTSGNASVFGDLSVARGESGAVSNFTRCVFIGGVMSASPNSSSTMDYVTFATDGNAADFGDMADSGRNHSSGCNGHGGL